MNRRARPQLSSPCPDACMRPSPRLPPRLPRHKQGPTGNGPTAHPPNPPPTPGPTPIAPYIKSASAPMSVGVSPYASHGTRYTPHTIASPALMETHRQGRLPHGRSAAIPQRCMLRRCQTSSSAPSSYASSNPASSQPASSSAPSAWQRPWPPAWPPAWPQA